MNTFEGLRNAIESILLNPLRSFLTMLGVIIGVFAVITLVSIGEGAKKYVTDQLSGLGTNVLIILPGSSPTSGGPPMITDVEHKLTRGDAEMIVRRCPSIDYVCPLIIATTTLKYKNRLRSKTHVGGTTHDYQIVRNMYADIGSFIPPRESASEKNLCVLGRTVVRDLFGPYENPLGKTIRIGNASFRVIGVMERKGYALGYDIDSIVFIPIQAAEELFDTDELYEILARARSTDHIDRAKQEIKALLTKRHDGYEDFSVNDQGEMLAALGNILNILTYALAGIAAISLLVGGIGIMNIMLVSVGERTREIGLRMAVGATRSDILWQFLIESFTIALLGGILGIALGVGLALLVHALVPSLPVLIRPWTVSLAFFFSFLVGLFFGVYPARKAASLDPIQALRYE